MCRSVRGNRAHGLRNKKLQPAQPDSRGAGTRRQHHHAGDRLAVGWIENRGRQAAGDAGRRERGNQFRPAAHLRVRGRHGCELHEQGVRARQRGARRRRAHEPAAAGSARAGALLLLARARRRRRQYRIVHVGHRLRRLHPHRHRGARARRTGVKRDDQHDPSELPRQQREALRSGRRDHVSHRSRGQ